MFVSLIEQLQISFKVANKLVNKIVPCSLPGGDSYMKQTGMLVVLLRCVNFGIWSRLGCSRQSGNILSHQGHI